MTPQAGIYTSVDADADIAAHAAVLDAHTKNIHEAVRVGSYLSCEGGREEGEMDMVQYHLYSCFICVPQNMTFDRAEIIVTTLDGGDKDIRFGVYNLSDVFVPGTLVEDFGTVDTDSAATKLIVFDPVLSLPKGFYLLACITDSDSTAKVRRRYGRVGGVGYATALQYAQVGFNKLQAAPQFAALPDPFPAAAALSIIMPMIGLRVASIG